MHGQQNIKILLSYCTLLSPEVQQFVIKRAVICTQYPTAINVMRSLTSISKF